MVRCPEGVRPTDSNRGGRRRCESGADDRRWRSGDHRDRGDVPVLSWLRATPARMAAATLALRSRKAGRVFQGDLRVTTVSRWTSRDARLLRHSRRMIVPVAATRLGDATASVTNREQHTARKRLPDDTLPIVDTAGAMRLCPRNAALSGRKNRVWRCGAP